jgi:hypothetical protein
MALTNNIVAYWKLDESSGDASDATGNGNTLTNTNVTYNAGIINNGATFSSITNTLLHADNASLSITGAMTINVWFKFAHATPTQAYNVLVNKYTAAGSQRSYQFYLTYSGGAYYMSWYVSANGASAGGLDYLMSNMGTGWHMYTVSLTPSTNMKFYLDGTLLNTYTTSIPSGIYDGTAIFYVGNNVPDGFADGTIDELGLWSRALTDAEVTSLYNSGAGLAYPLSPASAVNSGFFNFF